MQTVLVIAANRFLRESLLRLFRSDNELRVLGAVEFLPQIGERVSQLNPQIVVLNPEPDDAAFYAAHAIREAAPQAKILMIGMRDDPEMFLQAVRAGAVGYLLMDASPRRMLAAAHRLGRDLLVCPEHLMWALFRVLGDGSGLVPGVPEGAHELTPREQQLAGLLVQGLGNKEIADRLHLSLQTVKNHVHSILRKTQSKNRAVLAHRAEHWPLALHHPGKRESTTLATH
jgi:DNA-binding NarL/FixJ family response regulator